MQTEITEPGPLLDVRGQLSQPGWARQPLLDANIDDVASACTRRLRFKRWDYYGVWTSDLYVSATVAHLGYAGLAFFYVVDLVTRRHVEHTVTRVWGKGIDLPRNSDAGDTTYDHLRGRAAFRVTPGVRHLDVADLEFDGGRGLRIDLDLACPADHESIVVATPMGERRFYYNRKISGMLATGTIVWGTRSVRVRPNVSVGQLDWGRGVWPYRSHWIWASANGFVPHGRSLGINLGGGLGDDSAATENAIFLNGRLHKLGAVDIDFEPGDYRQPWRFADDAGRLELELRPTVERVARTNFGIIRSEVHQLFGRYSGRVVTDDGETIEVHNLTGFAEEHHARW